MPGSGSRLLKLIVAVLMGLAVLLSAVDFADARRAGSFGGFGSRGARTWAAPAPTRTAPGTVAPIERSMTPNTGATQSNRPFGMQAPGQMQRPGGLFGGFGGSMLGGLVAGGLLGMMLGYGFGGAGGMLSMLLQLVILAFLFRFAMRLFANRSQPAAAMGDPRAQGFGQNMGQGAGMPKSAAPQAGFGGRPPSVNPAAAAVADEPITVGQADLDHFEQMLTEVQSAYGREDYATLRKLATPEAMSWLAEELGETASGGKRNEVKDVKLLQGDISESWREGDTDYATVAMRYSAIDVMRDRNTGAVVEGDPDKPVESVEVWTFARKDGGEWKLSAIQSAE